jgi:hypothetical protein
VSYHSRREAIDGWVPKEAIVLYDYDATVVYVHDGRLVVLRVFSTGGPHLTCTWRVSVDVDRPIAELLEQMS